MTAQHILFSVDQNIGTLTLNRPESLNSLSLEMVKDLLTLVRRIAADGDVRALILTGAGRGFCAGWQLSLGRHSRSAGRERRGSVRVT